MTVPQINRFLSPQLMAGYDPARLTVIATGLLVLFVDTLVGQATFADVMWTAVVAPVLWRTREYYGYWRKK